MKPGGLCLLVVFWSIYHRLTSATLGFHWDQMRFVQDERWVGAQHI